MSQIANTQEYIHEEWAKTQLHGICNSIIYKRKSVKIKLFYSRNLF